MGWIFVGDYFFAGTGKTGNIYKGDQIGGFIPILCEDGSNSEPVTQAEAEEGSTNAQIFAIGKQAFYDSGWSD